MRLIDADKLIENINEIYKGYMTDESGCVPYDFERIVEEQPTAYDIDNAELFGKIFLEELERQAVNREEIFMYQNISIIAWNKYLEQLKEQNK